MTLSEHFWKFRRKVHCGNAVKMPYWWKTFCNFGFHPEWMRSWCDRINWTDRKLSFTLSSTLYIIESIFIWEVYLLNVQRTRRIFSASVSYILPIIFLFYMYHLLQDSTTWTIFIASPKWSVIIQSIVHQIDGRERWMEFGGTVSQNLIILLQVPFSWSWWLSWDSQQATIPPISFPSSIWGEVFMPVLSARALNYDS